METSSYKRLLPVRVRVSERTGTVTRMEVSAYRQRQRIRQYASSVLLMVAPLLAALLIGALLPKTSVVSAGSKVFAPPARAQVALGAQISQAQAQTQVDTQGWESLTPEERQAIFERGLPAKIRPFYKPASVASDPASSKPPAGLSQPLEECWTVAPSDNPGTGANLLVGVSTLSETDGFSVGGYTNTIQPDIFNHMVLRFNGASWPTVNTGITINGSNFLQGVHTNTPLGVWAVGAKRPAIRYESFILHYNGSAWSEMTPPHSGNGDNVLASVSGNGPNNVTAVGYKAGPSGGTQHLILRFNGSTWLEEASPNPSGFFNFVTDVDYFPSTNNRIAVGHYLGSNPLTFRPMAMESINGGPWTLLNVPLAGATDHFVNGVSTAAPSEAWLAGYYSVGANTQTLIYNNINGNINQVPSPNLLGHNNLYSITMTHTQTISGTFGMAVGAFNDGSGDRPLALPYDGVAFRARAPISSTGTLYAYDPDRARQLLDQAGWTVGIEGITVKRTVAVSFRSICGGPQPTPTGTTVPPSRTPTVGPPTATPTPCVPNTYSDVPPNHTFYPFITCLSQRGVIGGYSDCTFRPQNDITRGQVAKVVSNAAGFVEPVGGQTYQDVPPTQTFWEWIERLTRRGVMGGYPCGGTGEPCIGNRPYFRPGADATRGQLSKIVANASNNNDPVSGQFYTDVGTSNPFYTEIMRLTGRGVMSGYACGGAGEPCDTQNRPYFRWGANVTRGQASKIVANAFFPNCQVP